MIPYGLIHAAFTEGYQTGETWGYIWATYAMRTAIGERMNKANCTVCHDPIETMTFRGTGVCCEICRKERDGELTPEQAAVERKASVNVAVVKVNVRNPGAIT